MADKLIRLMTALSSQTMSNEARWTEVIREVYRTTVEDVIIRISRKLVTTYDDDGEGYEATVYVLSMSAKGREIEEAEYRPGDAGYREAEQLFRAARSSALNTNEVLDSVLKRLGVNP